MPPRCKVGILSASSRAQRTAETRALVERIQSEHHPEGPGCGSSGRGWRSPDSSTAMLLQPLQDRPDAPGGQSYAAVGSTIVKIHPVPVRRQGVAAGKDHVVHVAVPLVWGLRCEDPVVAASYAASGVVQVEE